MNETTARTKWGRARLGDGRTAAMAIAIPGGFVMAAGAGAAATAAGFGGERPVLGGVVLGLCLAAPFIALLWAILVDRDTLAGAAKRPEESVESTWLDRAALGALADTVVVVGIALAVLTIASVELDARLALLGVLLVAGVSGAVRYLVARSRG